MAKKAKFQPVAFFMGILYADETVRDKTLALAEVLFGPLELRTEPISFEYTDYYNDEMGEDIMRMWVGSPELADPADLANWKLATDEIEWQFTVDGRRTINLDPGFVGLSKVVLASLKDHPQRVPLKDGVYADIELIFKHDRWHTTPWTYPDYVDKPALDFLTKLREALLAELKSKARNLGQVRK